jgi:hypothetical protein
MIFSFGGMDTDKGAPRLLAPFKEFSYPGSEKEGSAFVSSSCGRTGEMESGKVGEVMCEGV